MPESLSIEQAAEKFRIRGISSNMIDRFWPLAEPYIKRALDRGTGEFLPSDIRTFCKDRVCQLWLVSENDKIIAAITTEILTFPRNKHLKIITLAGSRAAEWTGLATYEISEWAKTQGCTHASSVVRKGYVPILEQYGFKPKAVSIVRELV